MGLLCVAASNTMAAFDGKSTSNRMGNGPGTRRRDQCSHALRVAAPDRVLWCCAIPCTSGLYDWLKYKLYSKDAALSDRRRSWNRTIVEDEVPKLASLAEVCPAPKRGAVGAVCRQTGVLPAAPTPRKPRPPLPSPTHPPFLSPCPPSPPSPKLQSPKKWLAESVEGRAVRIRNVYAYTHTQCIRVSRVRMRAQGHA